MTGKQLAKTSETLLLDWNEVMNPPPNPIKDMTGSHAAPFNAELLNTLGATLWLPATLSEDQRSTRIMAALSALRGFKPRDEVEGMMAAQAVALHHAAMECMRRAMIPEQSAEVAARMRRDGANLMRAMVDMAEAIDRRRGKGQQTVRVEHVTVQAGGQAIVGTVTAAGAIAPGGGVDG